jgi:hypothetical protein
MHLNRTTHVLAIPVLLLLAAAIPAARVQKTGPDYKRSSLVRLEAKIDLKAPAAKVWDAITSSRGFAAATGFKIADTDKHLAKLGDAVPASVWSDKGNLVCTFGAEGKELRVTFEPDNGSYLCQKRITLETQSGGTRLTILDRYTDDQTETVDKTAKEVLAEMPKQLAAFQAMVEKP